MFTIPQKMLLTEMDFDIRKAERAVATGDIEALGRYLRQQRRSRPNPYSSAPSVEKQSKELENYTKSWNSHAIAPWQRSTPTTSVQIGITYPPSMSQEDAVQIAKGMFRMENYEVNKFEQTQSGDHCPMSHRDDYNDCMYDCPLPLTRPQHSPDDSLWIVGDLEVDENFINELENEGAYQIMGHGVTVTSEWPF